MNLCEGIGAVSFFGDAADRWKAACALNPFRLGTRKEMDHSGNLTGFAIPFQIFMKIHRVV